LGVGQYEDGNFAAWILSDEDGEQITKLTVNIVDPGLKLELSDDHFWVKNSDDTAKQVVAALVAKELVEPIGIACDQGFVEEYANLYKVKP
jgi:hypothetical protein